ncbi:MAG: type VII toxin-antitoxin system HepT family RNase toxin [Endozoicomonas sp.]
MRDKAYELEIDNLQQEMLLILDDLNADLNQWNARDLLAAQRALQIIIESLIGLSRYAYQQKYNINVSKSRAALDGLFKQGDLTRDDHELAMKMIGFRNVLVHDYLDVNRKILEAIIGKKLYFNIRQISEKIQKLIP